MEERSNESRLQLLFATLPLGPTAFLFGDEYNTLVNEIYFKKDNIEQKNKTTPTQASTQAPTQAQTQAPTEAPTEATTTEATTTEATINTT